MSDKTKREKMKEKTDNATNDVKTQLNDLRSDVLDLKQTVTSESHNTKRKTKYIARKRSNYIAIGLIAFSVVALIIGYTRPEWIAKLTNPPEWLLLSSAFIALGIIVGIVPAIKVADYFVTDDRKHLVENSPEDLEDIAVYKIPNARMQDIEVLEGEPRDIKTIAGRGIEVEKFVEIVKEGEQYLVAKATWLGEKSGLEIRKNEKNIEAMREEWKPKVESYHAMNIAFTFIIEDLQTEVVNSVMRHFENVATFDGKDLRNTVESTVEKYKPKNMNREVSQEEISDVKDQMPEEMSETLDNAMANGEK